jgi:hypothetical protein
MNPTGKGAGLRKVSGWHKAKAERGGELEQTMSKQAREARRVWLANHHEHLRRLEMNMWERR